MWGVIDVNIEICVGRISMGNKTTFWDKVKLFLDKLWVGLATAFGIIVGVLIVDKIIDKDDKDNSDPDSELGKTQIKVIVNNKKQNPPSGSITDDDMQATKDKIKKAKEVLKKNLILLFLLIPTILFSANGYNYDDIYRAIDTNVISFEEIRDMATRYFIITEHYPDIITYPYSEVYIKGNKEYMVTNLTNHVVVEYKYKPGKSDILEYYTVPEITVTYTNKLKEVEDIIPIEFTDIFLGAGFFYDYTSTNSYAISTPLQLGYCFDVWKLKLTPGIMLDPYPTYLDFFVGIYYNVYRINLGLSISVLRPNVGISIGFNPTKGAYPEKGL